MHHMTAAVLQPFHHQCTWFVAVGEADGEQLAQRRILFERRNQFIAELIRFDPVPNLLRQVARYDAAALQRPEALQNDGHRGDGANMIGHMKPPPARMISHIASS